MFEQFGVQMLRRRLAPKARQRHGKDAGKARARATSAKKRLFHFDRRGRTTL